MVSRTQVESPLRVVLDTHVILSALLFKAGRVSWVLDYLKTGRIMPLVSKETAHELLRVLAIKGKADYLVTGDRDLLSVQGFTAGPIVTPECFLQITQGVARGRHFPV